MHALGTVPKRHAALRVAGGALRVRGAVALLLASCVAQPEATAPVAQPEVAAPVAQPEVASPVAQPEVTASVAQPDAVTPAQILRATADTYANCHTYRDTGRATTKFVTGELRPVMFAPFQTAFERPDQFRFGVQGLMLGWIVWRHGPAVRSWSRHDGFEKPESLDSALVALAGVSAGSSIAVPRLLLGDAARGPLLMQMTDLVRLDDAELNGSHCYCLRGREAICATTVWIDQTSHLLLRMVRELDVHGEKAEVTITYEPVVDEAIPADLLAFGSPEG